jgi:hypothetical protein
MFEFIDLELANIKGSKKLRKIVLNLKKIFGEKDPGVIDFDFTNKPSRLKVVQGIINHKKYKSYLEIGTFDDELFSFIKCENKVGVDPASGGTHRMTSDTFFSKNDLKFDCIFIDGLHHYDQVIKDIKNSLAILNNGGIILMHDCLPVSLGAQSVPRTEVNWNGDVWKAFVEQRTNILLDCYTCYADHGIGVILKRKNRSPLNIINKNFKKLKFLDFYKNHNELMNIIEYDDLLEVLDK